MSESIASNNRVRSSGVSGMVALHSIGPRPPACLQGPPGARCVQASVHPHGSGPNPAATGDDSPSSGHPRRSLTGSESTTRARIRAPTAATSGAAPPDGAPRAPPGAHAGTRRQPRAPLGPAGGRCAREGHRLGPPGRVIDMRRDPTRAGRPPRPQRHARGREELGDGRRRPGVERGLASFTLGLRPPR